jgi:hypothetical protein
VDVRDRGLFLPPAGGAGPKWRVLRVEDLVDEEPVRADPADKNSPPLPCLSIHLGCTKTTTSNDNEHVLLIGRPVTALKQWLAEAAIKGGPVFRRIDQWGNVDRRALTPQSVNLILKARAKQAGLDPKLFSAHGLRSDYLTEPAHRDIPLPEAMQQSRHKSVTQAASYYNNAERTSGPADRLGETTRRTMYRLASQTTAILQAPLPAPKYRSGQRPMLPCPTLQHAASATPSLSSSDTSVAGRRRAQRSGGDRRTRRSPRRLPAVPPPIVLSSSPTRFSLQNTVSSPLSARGHWR